MKNVECEVWNVESKSGQSPTVIERQIRPGERIANPRYLAWDTYPGPSGTDQLTS